MQVTLKNKAAFIEALKDYQPSTHARKILESVPLGIFLGLSASGRNTIINELVKTGRYHFIVSDTTRPPKVRDGTLEQDGINYHFRTEEDVLSDIQNGKFLEAEVIHNQQVSGISVRELEEAFKTGKIPLNEVDIAGTKNIRRFKPGTTFFFVLPPSYEVWMERLRNRENITDEEMQNRKDTAVKVLEEGFRYDDWHFVINDILVDAVSHVDGVLSGKADPSSNAQAKVVAGEILRHLTT